VDSVRSGFNKKLGECISWLSLALVVVTVYDVTLRYLFSSGSVAAQELEWHLFAFLFLLAAGYTQAIGGHVRVDIIYSRLSKRGKAVVDLLGDLFFLTPFCLLLIWHSIRFVETAYQISETSPDAGGLPFRFIVKAAIPLGFSLLLIQALSDSVKNLKIISSGSSAVESSDE